MTPLGRSPSWGWPLVAVLGTLVAVGAWFALVTRNAVPPGGYVGPGVPSIWWIFPVGFVLAWALFWAVVRPWRWWGRGCGVYAWESSDEPTTIVRARYARGEISHDQMVGILRDLSEE